MGRNFHPLHPHHVLTELVIDKDFPSRCCAEVLVAAISQVQHSEPGGVDHEATACTAMRFQGCNQAALHFFGAPGCFEPSCTQLAANAKPRQGANIGCWFFVFSCLGTHRLAFQTSAEPKMRMAAGLALLSAILCAGFRTKPPFGHFLQTWPHTQSVQPQLWRLIGGFAEKKNCKHKSV